MLSGLAFLPQPTPHGSWDLERTGGPLSFPLHSESLSVLGKVLFLSGPRGPSSAPVTPAPYKGGGVWIRSLQGPCNSDPGGGQASVLSPLCGSVAVDQLMPQFPSVGAWLGRAPVTEPTPAPLRVTGSRTSCGPPACLLHRLSLPSAGSR